jgi:hypothetical protein
MSNAPATRNATAEVTSGGADICVAAEIEAEIEAGMAEFDRDEYVELTREQLDRAATTGETARVRPRRRRDRGRRDGLGPARNWPGQGARRATGVNC